jgi:hypothetical protein
VIDSFDGSYLAGFVGGRDPHAMLLRHVLLLWVQAIVAGCVLDTALRAVERL